MLYRIITTLSIHNLFHMFLNTLYLTPFLIQVLHCSTFPGTSSSLLNLSWHQFFTAQLFLLQILHHSTFSDTSSSLLNLYWYKFFTTQPLLAQVLHYLTLSGTNSSLRNIFWNIFFPA